VARPETKEENMKALTITELMRLTKIELTVLEAKTALKLPELPLGSPERSTAAANLREIRRVLIWRRAMQRLTP
jgi:hypothetical protein